jgi:hypothetical protein
MRPIIASLFISICCTLCTANAQAFNINSIQLEVRASTYSVQVGDSIAALLAEFRSSSPLICAKNIRTFESVGSRQSCDGPTTNVTTLIAMTVAAKDLTASFEFGPDWGRGGVVFIENLSSAGPVVDDLWWKRDWANPDVLRFDVAFAGMQEYTLNFLGFESCCGGGMSLRYTTEPNEEDSWQDAGVSTVSAPSMLALMGIGLLGLGAGPMTQKKRRQATSPALP